MAAASPPAPYVPERSLPAKLGKKTIPLRNELQEVIESRKIRAQDRLRFPSEPKARATYNGDNLTLLRICYLDAFSRISGDMTVGALVDAGAPCEALLTALESLDIGARYAVEKTTRRGITASKFRVHLTGAPQKHRHLSHILRLIETAPLTATVKTNAASIFERLGKAEAQVHGVPVEKVHFHEVGAADSIADIVGACVALDLLGVNQVHVSAINVGSGTVLTEHGVLPVPCSRHGGSAGRATCICPRPGDGTDHAHRRGDRVYTRKKLRPASGHANFEHRTRRGRSRFSRAGQCAARACGGTDLGPGIDRGERD